jgi:hypothetical protein
MNTCPRWGRGGILRALSTQPDAMPSPEILYKLAVRATASLRTSENAMQERIAAELRAGRTPT